MFPKNRKLTRDLGKPVRYRVGKDQAQDHPTFNKSWTNKQFDDVDCDYIYRAMNKKPA
jgi:hypothetical protein